MIVKKKFFTFAYPPHEFVFEMGKKLGPLTIAYETYGELNEEKTNGILVLHALTGDSHAAGFYSSEDLKPGWWDNMVGPKKPIDTEKFFVICSNVIGGCMGSTGPASIDPKTNKPFGMRFPFVTIGDMVRAQKRLIDHLGIKKLLAVIGGSMGGMQALEWSVRYPHMVHGVVPIATTAKHSAMAIAFNEVARQAIINDPNWNYGDYYDKLPPIHGQAVARMIGHITYLSDIALRKKFDRSVQDTAYKKNPFDTQFSVSSYLRYQGEKFVNRFDANSFLYLTRATDYFNLAQTHGQGSLVKAFSKAKAKFLVISFSSDWLYPTYQSKELVKALKKNGLEVNFCEIRTDYGHDSFLISNPKLEALVAGFLDNLYETKVKKGKC